MPLEDARARAASGGHRRRSAVRRNEYEVGDVVRYDPGSEEFGIRAGDYARVDHMEAKTDQLTLKTDQGHTVTYDPRRVQA